jgi:hypothetical protein
MLGPCPTDSLIADIMGPPGRGIVTRGIDLNSFTLLVSWSNLTIELRTHRSRRPAPDHHMCPPTFEGRAAPC